MSIRISQGGRLFGIIAGLGGAGMIGSVGLTWTVAFFRSSDYLRYDTRELSAADRRAMLVLGLIVIAGAVCFIAIQSRRARIAAGSLVVLAAAAGLVIALLAEPSLSGFRLPLRCTNAPGPTCLTSVGEGSGRGLAALGAVLAAGYGIVALLRSGGEAPPIPATDRPGGAPSGAGRTVPPTTPQRVRMSDARLLAWTMVAIVIAVVVGFFVVVWSICSQPTEWC